MDCSLPTGFPRVLCPCGFASVHGISQARIQEWVAIPFSRGSSQPRDETCHSSIIGRFYTAGPPWRLPWFPQTMFFLPIKFGDSDGKPFYQHQHSSVNNLQNRLYFSLSAVGVSKQESLIFEKELKPILWNVFSFVSFYPKNLISAC